MTNRIEALVRHAEEVADPEANRRTLEVGYGRAAEIVAQAQSLVQDCHAQYLVECDFWGCVAVLEQEDIQRYAVNPSLLRTDLAIATAHNTLSKQSLGWALVVIERMFGSVG